MKTWMLLLITILVLLFGCAGTEPFKYQPLDTFSSIAKSDPSTIHISGNFYEATSPHFVSATDDPSIRHYRIIITSDGGEAMACTGIINRMEELKKRGVTFTTVVYGKAYSAGAFIFMMGDHRIMHQGSSLMWHTIIAQLGHDGKEFPGPPGFSVFSQKDLLYGMDAYVVRMAKKAMPNVDPMTLETMLLYSGMTYIMATDAYELGMVDELVRN